MTRKLVHLHAGQIWIASEPGKGSTFTFVLPVIPQTTAETIGVEVVTDSVVGNSDSPLVLVVEDDRSASDLICHHLTQGGYDVMRAFNAEQALAIAREHKPVAMTLDIMLPRKDGWQLLAELRASPETKDIPVIVVSITEDKTLGCSLGVADWLVKPVNRTQLLNALGTIITADDDKLRRVLVVDDEPATVEQITDILEQHAFSVLKAYGGQEGVDLAIEHAPDVIILDLIMPDMNGFDVVDRLKQHPGTCNIPILVFTAKDVTKEDRQRLWNRVQAISPKSAKDDLLNELERIRDGGTVGDQLQGAHRRR